MSVYMICCVLWVASLVQSDDLAIRLAGGPNSCEGRVEVYYKDAWGVVCSVMWDLPDAEVVCRELNCGAAIEALMNGEYGPGAPYSGLTTFKCTGEERTLLQCSYNNMSHKHTYSSDAGVKCLGRPSSSNNNNISNNNSSISLWQLQIRITSHIDLEYVDMSVLRNAIISAVPSLLGKTSMDLTIRKVLKLQ